MLAGHADAGHRPVGVGTLVHTLVSLCLNLQCRDGVGRGAVRRCGHTNNFPRLSEAESDDQFHGVLRQDVRACMKPMGIPKLTDIGHEIEKMVCIELAIPRVLQALSRLAHDLKADVHDA